MKSGIVAVHCGAMTGRVATRRGSTEARFSESSYCTVNCTVVVLVAVLPLVAFTVMV
jgi:hypothetical protein